MDNQLYEAQKHDRIVTAVQLLELEASVQYEVSLCPENHVDHALWEGAQIGKIQAAVMLVKDTKHYKPGEYGGAKNDQWLDVLPGPLFDIIHDIETTIGGLKVACDKDPDNHNLQFAYEAMERSVARIRKMVIVERWQ